MPAGAIHQLGVSSRRRPAVAGMVVDVSQDAEHDVLINQDPQATELYTCVIDTATNSEEYGVNLTVPVIASIVYTADASAALAEIADGLAALWNANTSMRGTAVAVSDGVDTITFTGVFAGVAFTMEEDENAAKMTLTNTTNAASAIPIPFGRAVIQTAYETSEGNRLGILAAAASMTAQVDTWTLTYDAGIEISMGIEVDGVTYITVPFAQATNLATVTAALDVAIDAAVPANTVIATNTATTVVVTAELAGRSFRTWIIQGVGGTATLPALVSNAGVATDINRALAGISTYSYDEQQAAIATESAEYAANAGVDVLKRGQMWVENAEAVTHDLPVYIEMSTAADLGKFFIAGGATLLLVDIDKLAWRRTDHAASGAWDASDAGVAQLSVNIQP